MAEARPLDGFARAAKDGRPLRSPPLPFTRAELERVCSPLEQASQLPPVAYFDEEVFAFEQDTLFAKSWIAVGREEEIALPGAFLRARVAGEDLVIVRGADLRCRAFHNVCRHRGAPLCTSDSGRSAAIRCPYHGWTWELSGALREAPHTGSLQGFDAADQGLAPARVEIWQGFVFVTLDEGSPPLGASLHPAPPRLAGMSLLHLRLGRRRRYSVAANWKLLVENFQESLHFSAIHPGLERLTPSARADSVLGDGPWLGGTMDIVDGRETVSMDGLLHGRPLLAGTGPNDQRRVFDALLFPALLWSVQPDYLLTYRLTPLSTRETSVVADIHFHSAAFGPHFDPAEVYAFWDGVNEEDRAICEQQQMALRSRAHRPGRYTSVEDGVHAFDRRLARHYLEGVPAESRG
jgi:Rieske 2Fe-2S family protein